MLNQLPQVTKNLLILNILMFIGTYVMRTQGVDLEEILGLHSFSSPLFRPYQLVTHFFMHGNFFHLLFNMLILLMFGAFLERIWGAKRFLIIYIVSAFGAVLLYNGISEYQLFEMRNQMTANGIDYSVIDNYLAQGRASQIDLSKLTFTQETYAIKEYTAMLGASGALFGITAAFAILFPNTELMLLFPPIPIKAKYLIGGYFVLEVYLSFATRSGDNIAHLAHVGGAIAGAILVLIWRKRSNNFY